MRLEGEQVACSALTLLLSFRLLFVVVILLIIVWRQVLVVLLPVLSADLCFLAVIAEEVD